MQRLNVQTHPELRCLSLGNISLEWSKHALHTAAYNSIDVVNSITVEPGAIVELEREGSRTSKLVVRTKYNSMYDRVSVIVPMSEGLFRVVTTYLNEVSDNHATLRRGRLSA